jgi:hypothetical protein
MTPSGAADVGDQVEVLLDGGARQRCRQVARPRRAGIPPGFTRRPGDPAADAQPGLGPSRWGNPAVVTLRLSNSAARRA